MTEWYGLLPVLEQSLKDDGVSWFVAETKHPVGFAEMIWESPIPETPVSGALLSKLYLSPDHTGKKYGRQLFEHMVKLARQRGASFLWPEVLAQNERARQFCQQRGMQSIKETRLITASRQSVLKIMGISI